MRERDPVVAAWRHYRYLKGRYDAIGLIAVAAFAAFWFFLFRWVLP
jgi:hypothetical protein